MVVDVDAVGEVSDLAQYDAVILGSAVYMGNWLEGARRFVTEHAGELAARPTWLFSSGPTGDPPRPAPERAVSIDAITASITPKDHRLFPGKLDRHQLSFPEQQSFWPSVALKATTATGMRSPTGPPKSLPS